jgi:hypothetical protein
MSTYSAAVLAAKPTLYWPLNDGVGANTVEDWGPNALVGTVGSAITLGTTALVGSDARTSATLPVSGAYSANKLISSAQSALLQPTAAISFEFVLRIVSTAAAAATSVLSIGANGAGSVYGPIIQLSPSNVLQWYLYTGASVFANVSALTVGVDYHVVFSYDGITQRIYVNGTLAASSTATSGPISGYDGAHGLVLGQFYTSATATPNVNIQDVAVYAGSVLSAAVVAQHAALAAGYLTTPYEAAVLAASPVLFWPLGDAPGTVAKDYGPNNLTGAVGSAVTLGSASLAQRDATTSAQLPATTGTSTTKQIVAPTNTALNPTTGFTFECIIQVNSWPTNYAGGGILWENSVTASTATIAQLLQFSSAGVLNALINNSAVSLVTAAVISLGVPFHLALAYDGAHVVIYVNGVSVASVAYTAALSAYGNGPFLLGNSYSSAPGTFVGFDVQGVAYYASGLSATVIAQHAAIAGLDATSTALLPAAAGISTPYMAAVLADAPVGFWRLDDPTTASTIRDSSGNNISGSWQTGVTRRVAGLLASEPGDPATSFPSGAYAANKVLSMLTGPIALLQPTQSFSCDFLLNIASLATQTIVSTTNAAGSAYSFAIAISNTGQVLAILNSNAANANSPVNTIAAGNVYHVAVTYDRTTLRTYVNGTQVASTAYTAALSGGSAFSIGDAYTSRTGEAQVTIGQVAFYPQALSPARVLAHYTATQPAHVTQSIAAGAGIISKTTQPLAAAARTSATVTQPLAGGGAVIRVTLQQSLPAAAMVLGTAHAPLGAGASIITSTTQPLAAAGRIVVVASTTVAAGAMMLGIVDTALAAGAFLLGQNSPPLPAAGRIKKTLFASLGAGLTIQHIQDVGLQAQAVVIAPSTPQSLAAEALLAVTVERALDAGASLETNAYPTVAANALLSGDTFTPLGAAAAIQSFDREPIGATSRITGTPTSTVAAGAAIIAAGQGALAGAAWLQGAAKPSLDALAAILTSYSMPLGAGAELQGVPSVSIDAGATIFNQIIGSLGAGAFIEAGQSAASLGAAAIIIVGPLPDQLAAGARLSGTVPGELGAGVRIATIVDSSVDAASQITELQYASANAAARILRIVTDEQRLDAAGRISVKTAKSIAADLTLVANLRESILAAGRISARQRAILGAGAMILGRGSDELAAQGRIAARPPGGGLHLPAAAYLITFARSAITGDAAIAAPAEKHIGARAYLITIADESTGAAGYLTNAGAQSVNAGARIASSPREALGAGAEIQTSHLVGIGAGASISVSMWMQAASLISETARRVIGAGANLLWLVRQHLGGGARIVEQPNPYVFVNRKNRVRGEQRHVDVRPMREQFRDERQPRPRQQPYRAGSSDDRPFDMVPPPAPANDEFTFVQTEPAAVWVITHDLGHYASVTTVDNTGEEIEGDVTYPELNVVIVSFSIPVAGIAYLV